MTRNIYQVGSGLAIFIAMSCNHYYHNHHHHHSREEMPKLINLISIIPVVDGVNIDIDRLWKTTLVTIV